MFFVSQSRSRGYSVLATPLADVEKTLMFKFIPHIINLLAVQKEVVILDWGGGAGEAANALAKQLRHAKVQNVKIYVLSDLYFTQWHRNEKSITYIYGDYRDLAKYNLPQVDFVFSHFGLWHLETDDLIDHFRELRGLLRPGARVIYNTRKHVEKDLIDLTFWYDIKERRGDFSPVFTITLKQNGSFIYTSVETVKYD